MSFEQTAVADAMREFFKHLLIVPVPLVFTGVFHMLAVRKGWLGIFDFPIWQNGFGKNKTWRGVFLVSTGNALLLRLLSFVFGLELAHPFLLGLALGLAYVLFELPNSFLKRKVGIQPGGHHSKYKYLFYILDKSDSSFGVTLVYFAVSGISIMMACALFLTNGVVHVLVSLILLKLKIKSEF